MIEMRVTVSSVTCPTCGAQEMHPNGEVLLIRGFKVFHSGAWWSQCLVCAGYYDENLVWKGNEAGDPDGGWFR